MPLNRSVPPGPVHEGVEESGVVSPSAVTGLSFPSPVPLDLGKKYVFPVQRHLKDLCVCLCAFQFSSLTVSMDSSSNLATVTRSIVVPSIEALYPSGANRVTRFRRCTRTYAFLPSNSSSVQ